MLNSCKSFWRRCIVVMSVCASILLLSHVSSYAETDKAAKDIADSMSLVIKDSIEKNTITGREQILDKVADMLRSMSKSEMQIQKIKDSLGSWFVSENITVVQFHAGTIATAVQRTIEEQLKQNSGMDKQMENINERINRLEAAKQEKMLLPHEDVNFLFEAVLSGTYDDYGNKRVIELQSPIQQTLSSGNTITIQKIEINRQVFGRDKIKFIGDNGKELTMEEADPNVKTKTKMQVVEETLGITNTEPDLIKRIDRAYGRINNVDWQKDNIRFGILVSSLADSKVVATSIAVHAYFGYRRHTPSNWWDFYNFGRRLSGFFAVGSPMTSSNDTEVKSPILSAGLGLDIEKGFVLSVGYSIFSYKEKPTDSSYKPGDSLMFGITLSSDLWRELFNNR